MGETRKKHPDTVNFDFTSLNKYIIALVLLLVLGFCNELTLPHLLEMSGHKFSHVLRAMLFVLDAVVIILLVLLFLHFKSFNIDVFFQRFTFIIVLLVLSELGLLLVFKVVFPNRDLRTFKQKVDHRALLPAHQGAEWAIEDAREKGANFYQKILRSSQFRCWDGGEYTGKWTNVDKDGYRMGWDPPSASEGEIYVFGGSTIWGMGAPDEGTIPSIIAKKLHQQGQSRIVRNCGELGYNSTQEVIHFAEMLHRGEIPEIAIFYHGYNDVTYAYQSGKAGYVFRLGQLNRSRIEIQDSPVYDANRTAYLGLEQISGYSLIFRATSAVIHKLPGFSLREWTRNLTLEAVDVLAVEIVDHYLKNVELARNLALAHDVKVLFFWQPMIFHEKRLLEGEIPAYEYYYPPLKEYGSWPPPGVETRKYEYTSALLPTGKVEHFYNISDALDKRTSEVYLDAIHISQGGNEIVADRILSVLNEGGYLDGGSDE